ncbi:MAG: hypothetical protein ABIG11_06180 [bacterium]
MKRLILAVTLIASVCAFSYASMSSLENAAADSAIAASAGDAGLMRDIAMQPFEGSIALDAAGAVAVPASAREEAEKVIASKTETVRPALAAKVPAISKNKKADSGNIAMEFAGKFFKYAAIATVAALLVGGAVAGAAVLGVPGMVVGIAAGAAAVGYLGWQALKAYWNTF